MDGDSIVSYHITIDYRPEGKYPFAMNTEADQIPLTITELEALRNQCQEALQTYYRDELAPRYTFPTFQIKEIRNECPAHA
jgi:hypothetical protein